MKKIMECLRDVAILALLVMLCGCDETADNAENRKVYGRDSGGPNIYVEELTFKGTRYHVFSSNSGGLFAIDRGSAPAESGKDGAK